MLIIKRIILFFLYRLPRKTDMERYASLNFLFVVSPFIHLVTHFVKLFIKVCITIIICFFSGKLRLSSLPVVLGSYLCVY